MTDNLRDRIGQRHRRADFNARRRNFKLRQFRDAARVDNGVQLNMLLGDPQADVGTARQDGCVGIG